MLDKLGTILGDYLVLKLGQELTDQGHKLTGALIASLEYRIRTTATGMTIDFLANEYGEKLNTGIPASQIPKYPSAAYLRLVLEITRYVERRMGLRGGLAKKVAGRIVRAWGREGMPTRNSYKFAKNNRRTGWVDVILRQEESEIERMVADFVGRELEVLFSNFVKQAA